jgi:hypothetical protein
MRLRENLTPEILELKINQSQSSDYFDWYNNIDILSLATIFIYLRPCM